MHLRAHALALERRDEGAVVPQLPQLRLQPELGAGHLGAQHGDDVAGALVAEELAEGLFVPADAMARDHLDEVPLGVAGQRGFVEMRVPPQEALEPDVEIGEIAPSAARDADLLAGCLRVIDDERVRPGMGSAHHAGGAGAEDQGLDFHRLPLTTGPRLGQGAGSVRPFPRPPLW